MSIDIKTRILEVLNAAHLMSLATLDEGGLWVSDVIFVYDDDLNIFWMSDPSARHSKTILKNQEVAGTITASNKSNEPSLGIQFSGKVEKIDGPRYDLAVKHLKKRSLPGPKESEDVLDGDSWYVLNPKKIELIDETNFGYIKKSLDIL